MRRLNRKGFVFHAEYLLVIVAVLAGILAARPVITGAAQAMLERIIGQANNMVQQITFLN